MENTDHTTPILPTVNRNTIDASKDKDVMERFEKEFPFDPELPEYMISKEEAKSFILTELQIAREEAVKEYVEIIKKPLIDLDEVF